MAVVFATESNVSWQMIPLQCYVVAEEYCTKLSLHYSYIYYLDDELIAFVI